MKKNWTPVPDFFGYYEVNDAGEIRSVARNAARIAARIKRRNSEKTYMSVVTCTENGGIST